MVLTSDIGGVWEDRTLTIDQLIRMAGRWLPTMTALSILPYVLIWGFPSLPHWSGVGDAILAVLAWTLIGLGVYAVSAIVHEGLHVAAMLVMARVPMKSLRFGVRPSEGVLYVHSDCPMSAAAYRVVLLLPFFLQGLLPAAAGTLLGVGWLVVYGYVMIVSAIGDLAVLQLIRDLDRKARVRDHPQEIGCQVLRAEP